MAIHNIKMKKKNKTDWDILYPITLASNVNLDNGQTVQRELDTIFDKTATSSKNGAMSSTDKTKLDGIEANANRYVHPNDANTRHVTDKQISVWNDKYTKLEIDNKFNELNSGLDWKESVATFDDIATTYPNPQDGWTVNTKDTDVTYRYTGTTWIAISANAIPMASQTTDGKMSKTDKKILDNLNVKVTDLERDLGSLGEGLAGDLSGLTSRITTTENNVKSINTDISSLKSGKADANHNHDSVYAKVSHTHSYVPLSGGTITGAITKTGTGAAFVASNGNSRTMIYTSTTAGEHIFGGSNDGTNEAKDYIRIGSNKLQFTTGGTTKNIYHEGNKPTPAAIGAATSNHTHTSLLATSLSGQTVSLDSYTLSSGSPHVVYYYCPTDGGGDNITGRPSDSNKNAFNLKVELVRWSSSTDYITKQTYTIGALKTTYVRYCTSGTWSAWEKVYTSVSKPTPSEIGAAASSHTHNYAGSSSAGGAANTALACSGNSATATKLATARTINGTSFDGSANITTSKWGTARILTIGNIAKSVDGSGNVEWSLEELGLADSNHSHNYAGSSSPGGAATSALACTGNSATATKLATARTINGVSFDGSANITITAAANGGTSASCTGNAATATALQTARTINGTSFNGSANITTANWGTARTLTIGNTGKSVNGSANVSWSLSEIGAAAASHTHSNYVPTTDYALTTISKTLTITTSWQDTGITGANLATGSYIVQVSGLDSSTTVTYSEMWTGIMSWYGSATNSTDSDEIILHKAGHASSGRTIYLRTIRSASSGYLKLQICASVAFSSSNVTFKFRRLI